MNKIRCTSGTPEASSFVFTILFLPFKAIFRFFPPLTLLPFPLPIIHSSLEFTPLIYKADKCLIVVVFNFVCILWPILTVSYNKYILLYSSHKALEIFFGSWNLYSPLYLTWFKMYGLISCILWHALLFGGIVKEDLSLSYPSPPNLSSYPILSAIGRNFPF